MAKYYKIFFAVLIAVLIADQAIKWMFLNGFDWNSQCISLNLTFNKGVAFGMLTFLGENLKLIQIALIGGVFVYVMWQKEIMQDYYVALGLILGGGISNLIDRFFQEGVVDYVYWHCGFDFAIFNFADVMIDLGVVLILIISFRKPH